MKEIKEIVKFCDTMDATECRPLVLGLIFLRFILDEGRWANLQDQAKQANIGQIIDDTLTLVEEENPKLKGVLDKRYARAQLPEGKLGELVDLISSISSTGEDSKDLLGQCYEYFIGHAEGKKGGQFYTPSSIVRLLVKVLAPNQGIVYDPCCGSGGMFVQCEKFIEAHGGKLGDVSIYGQECNPTTWRLTAMNLAIRGIDFNLGKEPADTFTNDQHADLLADFVMANPPFNVTDWRDGTLENDPRWVYGRPPQNNANYAWLQHILYHLKPNGRGGVVMNVGSLSTVQKNEVDIRRKMIEADIIECIVVLPRRLFTNTAIPVCLWFFAKQKSTRKGEVLFIYARDLGILRENQLELCDADIQKITDTIHAWRGDEVKQAYVDVPGFCKSATISEIEDQRYILIPTRYVGEEAVEDDGEPFNIKFPKLVAQLESQLQRGDKLTEQIQQAFKLFGFVQ